MNAFRDFTVPDWKIFAGNLLMFVTCACYVAWWAVTFRPNANGKTGPSALLITVALLAGVAAVTVLILGIASLSRPGKGLPATFILAGAILSYIVLLEITKIAFHRPVTSELLVMIIWAAVELAAIDVLRGSGRFGMSQALPLAVLVLLATCTGLVCYILYYRLDAVSSFWIGLIPLVADTAVVTAFLATQALS